MSGISRLIRSATLYGYTDLAQSLGLNAHAMLRRACLSAGMLEEFDQLIPLQAACELLEDSAQRSGYEDFGLRLAARRRLAHLGPVSIVLREEPTGMAALQTLTRYLQLVNPSLFTTIEIADSVVVIREELLSDARLPMRQPMEMAVGVMVGLLRDLLGKQWRARSVHFGHRAPVKSTTHQQFFTCPIQFDAHFNGIVCATQDLRVQLPDRDSDRATWAQRSLDRAMAQTSTNTSERVRQMVAVLLPQGRCSAAIVAEQLGIDRRTVHRQLLCAGESFSQILQSVRKDLALRQINDSDRSVEEIGYLLGFGSSSAFAHWFRTSYGQSVSQWRKNQ
jgi:AraC-like DNA-binding protein